VGARVFDLESQVELTAAGGLKARRPALLRQAEAGRGAGAAAAESGAAARPAPLYSLRKDLGMWVLTFDGATATLRHEKGVLYVVSLLYDPPAEPIHALDLAARLPALYRRQLGLSAVVDPASGKPVLLERTARLHERSLGLDEAEAVRRLLAKQRELEAVLDDEDASEPEKAEALRELEAVYEFLRSSAGRTRSGAENLVRAVRMAVNRFVAHLAAATDKSGQPHPVLRAFAEHLERHLLVPSNRYSGRQMTQARSGLAGRFTYEPPPGVRWGG
jgi:hypothetical protein